MEADRTSYVNMVFKATADEPLLPTPLSINIMRITSSSAVAEGPRDALSQLISCQLLHNCTKNHI